MVIPLSMVSITLLSSFLNSFIAFFSSLLILGTGGVLSLKHSLLPPYVHLLFPDIVWSMSVSPQQCIFHWVGTLGQWQNWAHGLADVPWLLSGVARQVYNP